MEQAISTEGRARYRSSPKSFRAAPSDTPRLADMLRWKGTALRDQGRTADADSLYQQSLVVATETGYEHGRAHALNCLGNLAQRRGDLSAAFAYYSTAADIAEQIGDPALGGMVHQNLGILADMRADVVGAIECYSRSLATFEVAGDTQGMMWVLNNLGLSLAKKGRHDEADAAYFQALKIARQRDDLMSEGVIEENRADLNLLIGDCESAYPSIARALDIAERRRDGLRRAAALRLRGAYLRLTGSPGDAIGALGHALTLCAAGEDALLGAEILYQFGLALWALGDRSTAQQVWTSARESFVRIDARDWIARVDRRLADGGTSAYL
jgi:tetratricopeptide (TPR) repeat protein